MTDDTITAQLRRTILNKIESYEIEDLKRIAYEVRCEEMGIYLTAPTLTSQHPTDLMTVSYTPTVNIILQHCTMHALIVDTYRQTAVFDVY